MSETKFTAGPWQMTTVPFELNNTDSAASIYGPTTKSGGACLIADISRSPGDDESIGNAKLFMASLDMYEELKTSHGFLIQLYQHLLTRPLTKVNIDDILQSLRDRMAKQLSIIAKATQ